MQLSLQVQSRLDLITKTRRDLHKIPELSCVEFKTQNYICDFLTKRSIVHKRILTGVVAEIKGLDATRTVALRADIDALPIQEANDVDYVSTHLGHMHACGHDGHTAMLLTLLDLLTENKPRINVRAIFQFGEEGAGGARQMMTEGVLKGVSEIYAIHIDPGLDEGLFATREGAMMAGTEEFKIKFYGRSAHCAEPKHGINALRPIGRLLESQDHIAIKNRVLFHVGVIEGGSACNIIASEAICYATIRYFVDSDKKIAYNNLKACLDSAKADYGTEYRVEKTAAYPPVVNTKKAVTRVKKVLGQFVLKEQTFTAEDFAFFTQAIDGALVWLGTKTQNNFSPLHSETFDFDEKALLNGVEFFRRIVC